VVPRGGAASLETTKEKDAFGHEVQEWMKTKVAKHKYLRGGKYIKFSLLGILLTVVYPGVVVIDAIPKR